MDKITTRSIELFHDPKLTCYQKDDIALMFEQLKDNSCVPHLIEEISDPKNEQTCQNLISVLGEFDCSEIFEKLFYWALYRNEEASNAVFDILEKQEIVPTQEEFDRCMIFLDRFEAQLPQEDENFDYYVALTGYMRGFMEGFTIQDYTYNQPYLH